ncbi:hypothetical protein RSAG8_04466, partial [Rhizoctonia solani AG-8 WAC10335]
MSHSARDHVNTLLTNNQAESTTQTSILEPQSAGNNTSIGLYDYPPDDPRSREHVTGRRQSRSTERNRQYRATRTRNEKKRHKSNDTRSKNSSQQRTRVREPSPEPQRCVNSNTECEGSNHSDAEAGSDTSQRGRSRTIHSLSRSPSVDSASYEHAQPTQTQGNSQYTYVYETVNHDDLVKFAQEFGLDVQGCGTQAIIRQLRVAEAEQAPVDGTSRCPPSVVIRPPVPLQVGGGFSQEVLGGSGSATPSNSKKRSSTDLVASNGSSKRQRATVEVSDDTATEPESDEEPVKLPHRGTHEPPLSRIPTATTVLQTQPSNTSSHSPSGSTRAQKTPKLPNITYLTTGPVHNRLRAELLQRFLNDPIDPAEATETAEADKSQPTDVDEIPEIGLDSTPNLSQRATCGSSSNRYTYKGYRSHVPSEPEADRASSPERNTTGYAPTWPDPPRITPSQRVQQERARAVAAKMAAELTGTTSSRSRVFSSASKPPSSRPQPRPPLGSKGNAVGRLEYSRAVAQGEATSFVESATRQSERTARCAAPKSRPRDGLLEDDEEILAQAEALAKGKWPKPSDEIFEIMVNNIATLRGKAKERLREFVARVSGFQQNLRDQNAIQHNLQRFNELYPNSYHCQSSNPRDGDYEHSEIGHCISLAIFHGANSVGVLYSDYFRDMPLPVVAFCLAMWQFCIEEWANGWRQNGDLGMGAMREKYEAQLAGLKELREAAPRRMNRLQDEWRDYTAGYSGAVFISDDADTASVRKSQMRPDTPEPEDAISIEEMEAQLFETARQESLRERERALAAHELEEMPVDEDDGSNAPTSHTRSPSPLPIERNEYGVVTARSKGKRRGN